ncbi:MAG: type II CAAX endopeptidase family protein, partial [Pseudomonadota bacterium]
PGWAEVAIGVLVFVIVGFLGGAMWAQSDLDPILVGLILTAWTGIAGLVAFAAAALLRIRKWSAFGIRAVSVRWLLIGAGMGLLAFAAKGIAVIAFTALTGQADSPQTIFALGASGGLGMALLATVFLGILTPIGEEFLFRGVLANALLRYGPIPGVLGSAVIFALLHGINIVFPAALVAGIVAGEIFRRSGSVWPAVMVHVVFNLPTIPIMLLVSAAQ